MPREGFSGIRWGSLHWTLKNRHDMFKDSESGKGLQKGRKLGLGPEGDVDPGLKQGCDWAPTVVVGSKVGYTGGGGHSPRLQPRLSVFRSVAGGSRLEPARNPTQQVRGLVSRGAEAG